MKKNFLALAIVLIAGIICLPYVHAEDKDTYATIKDITNEDSAQLTGEDNPTIEGNTTESVIVTYKDVKAYVPNPDEDSTNHRPVGFAWFGINVEKPTNAGDSPKYTRTANVALPESISKPENADIDDEGNYYFPISYDLLKAATEKGEALTYTYEFTWNNSVKQTVKILINPSNISLYDTKENAEDPAKTPQWSNTDYNKYKPVEASELDDVPKTGDSLPVALIGVVAIAIIGGLYNLKMAYTRR